MNTTQDYMTTIMGGLLTSWENVTLCDNLSLSRTDDWAWLPSVSVDQVVLVIIFSIITLLTTGGNCLVLAAIATNRQLRSRTNYFVFSLAVADLTVSILVMPFSVVNVLFDSWHFGWVFCYFWISCDVTCCTASILHLCVISMDRYLAITEPLTYKVTLSRRRALAMIACVWVCSIAISFIPIYLGWYSDGSVPLYVNAKQCGLYVNRTYAVISSTLSFYAPLLVMIFAYVKIFRIARRQAAEIAKQENMLMSYCCEHPSSRSRPANGSCANSAMATPHRRKSSHKRFGKDSKAIKTLGTLMGLFCVCWLPFFIIYLLVPFCTRCHIPDQFVLFITWLGYLNSFINPFVYAFLQRDFRNAFKRILLCQRPVPPLPSYYSPAETSSQTNRHSGRMSRRRETRT